MRTAAYTRSKRLGRLRRLLELRRGEPRSSSGRCRRLLHCRPLRGSKVTDSRCHSRREDDPHQLRPEGSSPGAGAKYFKGDVDDEQEFPTPAAAAVDPARAVGPSEIPARKKHLSKTRRRKARVIPLAELGKELARMDAERSRHQLWEESWIGYRSECSECDGDMCPGDCGGFGWMDQDDFVGRSDVAPMSAEPPSQDLGARILGDQKNVSFPEISLLLQSRENSVQNSGNKCSQMASERKPAGMGVDNCSLCSVNLLNNARDVSDHVVVADKYQPTPPPPTAVDAPLNSRKRSKARKVDGRKLGLAREFGPGCCSDGRCTHDQRISDSWVGQATAPGQSESRHLSRQTPRGPTRICRRLLMMPGWRRRQSRTQDQLPPRRDPGQYKPVG